MSPLRVVLCVDGAAPDELLGAAVPLLREAVVWVPTHIVDARARRDLGFLRGGITGAGPLSRSQQQAIDAATAEHTRAILAAAEASLRRRGLQLEPPQIRVGEPGREICAVAAAIAASLVVLFASRRARAVSGPGSSRSHRAVRARSRALSCVARTQHSPHEVAGHRRPDDRVARAHETDTRASPGPGGAAPGPRCR